MPPRQATARPWQERWDEMKPAPFRLTREVLPGLYQVRTRGSRAYLIVDDEITLIDTGNPGSGIRVLKALQEIGRSPEDIKHIVITHYHIDHVGGLPELQKHVNARTGVHLAEAPHVESDEPLPNPFIHPLLARICEPYLLRQDPGSARVDVHLNDGDELPALGGMRIVHAPGHTAGSISIHFPNRGLLLVGDAMQFKFGRLMLPSRLFTQDMAAAAASVRKLATLDFDTLCFSHFRPILTGADAQVRQFAATLPVGPS
ncbi:MAG: MBL fold metallo-hydrolase [Dehalococcoidia bacterium]|nr:MBL fold metallo-hydrolase [Dehalococcoidia bacterium]MCL4230781.1 MBL fold metallo-hydrolase [Dehalococcoidia bacterium]RIL04084.1 MAG: MBL fold metallo-hydrolase [bacterium]